MQNFKTISAILIYLYTFVGPLVGYLGCKFGVRAVSAIGALIGAVAVGACFFAESITLVIFLYGTLFGKSQYTRYNICEILFLYHYQSINVTKVLKKHHIIFYDII